MTAPEVREVVTEYLVTAWPEDLAEECDAYDLCVTVARRAPDRWAVLRGGGGSRFCLGAGGKWDFEPIPSERDEDWRAAHRFPLEQALDLARDMAPRVTVNGWSALARIEWHREHGAAADG